MERPSAHTHAAPPLSAGIPPKLLVRLCKPELCVCTVVCNLSALPLYSPQAPVVQSVKAAPTTIVSMATASGLRPLTGRATPAPVR